MTCPFQVGDRIHEVEPVWTYCSEAGDDVLVEPEYELDPTKPDATVTALTARGFTYRYDRPITVGRVAWGQTTQEGECYEDGFHLWRRV